MSQRTAMLAMTAKKASLNRSQTMARVKARDTSPEMTVRRLLTKLGCRYRVHRKDIPGNPDIAMIGRRCAIFVHGCFWHGHNCPRGARVPKSNTDYWLRKIARNRERDAATVERLGATGWRALTIWECELRDLAFVSERLRRWLQASDAPPAPGER
jgi:DNA mismatch endonuclease (patch repair protein)